VIIGVARVRLDDVVIDVADRDFRLGRGDSQRFELQVDHRPGRILGQRLIDLQADFGPLFEFALGQVGAQYLLSDRTPHNFNSFSPVGWALPTVSRASCPRFEGARALDTNAAHRSRYGVRCTPY
jgi:hypothetical protein